VSGPTVLGVLGEGEGHGPLAKEGLEAVLTVEAAAVAALLAQIWRGGGPPVACSEQEVEGR
jgi:hypothetical protein